MYIVPIAWIYVALMMSVAEATNSNGTLLGAIVTFVLYGLLPVGLMLYIMGTPGRKRLLRARAAEENAAWHARTVAHAAAAQPPAPAQALADGLPSALVHAPDAGSHAPADAVPAVRKEP